LFATLDEEELALVTAAGEFIELSEDEIVFSPGAPGDHLYVIDRGEVVIRSELDHEQGRELARFIAGESFGELDLLVRASRSAYAIAATDSRMVRFPGVGLDLATFFHRQPEVSARILFKLLANVAGRLRSTNRLISENTAWVRELRRQVYLDKLTGLYNAAFLKEELNRYAEQADSEVTLLMMKPDNFKVINDTYGHEAGDNTLRQLAAVFGKTLRDRGTAIRYRGNELAALIPRCSPADANALARELGTTVRTMDVSALTGGTSVTVTVSFGIGHYPSDRNNPELLVTDTHALLFVARAAGGDRVLHLGDQDEGD